MFSLPCPWLPWPTWPSTYLRFWDWAKCKNYRVLKAHDGVCSGCLWPLGLQAIGSHWNGDTNPLTLGDIKLLEFYVGMTWKTVVNQLQVYHFKCVVYPSKYGLWLFFGWDGLKSVRRSKFREIFLRWECKGNPPSEAWSNLWSQWHMVELNRPNLCFHVGF